MNFSFQNCTNINDFYSKHNLLNEKDLDIFLKEKNISKLGIHKKDTQKIVEDMYSHFKKKSTQNDIDELSSFFNDCNEYINCYIIILIHPKLTSKQKVKKVNKLFADTIIGNSVLIDGLVSFTEKCSDSYEKGAFPFADKDEFISIPKIKIKKNRKNLDSTIDSLFVQYGGGNANLENKKGNVNTNSNANENDHTNINTNSNSNREIIINKKNSKIKAIIKNIFLFFEDFFLFFEDLLDGNKKNVSIFDWIFFPLWSFFKTFGLLAKIPFNFASAIFFYLASLGSSLAVSVIGSGLKFGCTAINETIDFIVNTLASVIPGLSTLTGILLKIFGFLPNLICNKLGIFLPRLADVFIDLLEISKFWSMKEKYLLMQALTSFLGADEFMNFSASIFINLREIFEKINQYGKTALEYNMLLTDSLRLTVNNYNNIESNNSLKNTFDEVGYTKLIGKFYKSSESENLLKWIKNALEYLPKIDKKNNTFILMKSSATLVKTLNDLKEKSGNLTPIVKITKFYNQLVQYLNSEIIKTTINYIIIIFKTILDFIKDKSKKIYNYLYNKLVNTIQSGQAQKYLIERMGKPENNNNQNNVNQNNVNQNNVNQNNVNQKGNTNFDLNKAIEFLNNAEKNLLKSIQNILHFTNIFCDIPIYVIEEPTSFLIGRLKIWKDDNGFFSYFNDNFFSKAITEWSKVIELITCPDIDCNPKGLIQQFCMNSSLMENIAQILLSKDKNNKKKLSRAYLLSLPKLIKEDFPTIHQKQSYISSGVNHYITPFVKKLDDKFLKESFNKLQEIMNNQSLDSNQMQEKFLEFLEKKKLPTKKLKENIFYLKSWFDWMYSILDQDFLSRCNPFLKGITLDTISIKNFFKNMSEKLLTIIPNIELTLKKTNNKTKQNNKNTKNNKNNKKTKNNKNTNKNTNTNKINNNTKKNNNYKKNNNSKKV